MIKPAFKIKNDYNLYDRYGCSIENELEIERNIKNLRVLRELINLGIQSIKLAKQIKYERDQRYIKLNDMYKMGNH